jgi:hypothetical protein
MHLLRKAMPMTRTTKTKPKKTAPNTHPKLAPPQPLQAKAASIAAAAAAEAAADAVAVRAKRAVSMANRGATMEKTSR